MKYICPNVNCQTTWTITENTYLGGTDFNCTECNTTSQIPLYCPQCCPPAPNKQDKKTFLTTPKGYLGGNLYTCPRGHSFRVMVTLEEAHNKLRSLGREIGQYHQGRRIGVMQDARLKTLVSGGYCAGVALDWIRRVLLGGKPLLTNAENLMITGPLRTAGEYELRDKQWRQDVRGAAAWEASSTAKVNPFLNSQKQRLDNWIDEKMRECNEVLGASCEQFNRLNRALANKQGLSAQQRQALERKIRETYDREVAEANRVYEGQKEQYQTASRAPIMKKYWREFARVMDEYMTRDRNGKTSSRPFANMDVVKSINDELMAGRNGGITTLIDTILGDADFKPNRAVYIGISPPSGGSGHAVAAYRLNTGGNYHFFDPNFGVYEFSHANLRDAFIYIFSTAYPFWAGAGTSDNHPYEENGKTKGTYTIFAGTQPPTQSVVHQPPREEKPKVTTTPTVLKPITTLPDVKPTTKVPLRQPIAKKEEPKVETKVIEPKVNQPKVIETKTPHRPRAGAFSRGSDVKTGGKTPTPTPTPTPNPTPTTGQTTGGARRGGNKVSDLLKKFQG